MLRRVWKPVAAAVIVGTPAYLYFTRQETFELPIRTKGADGKTEMSRLTVPFLSLKALEARIREHATSNTYSRPGGTVWKHATAHLASNDPIEDANASQIVQRDESDPSAPGDYLFFAVMDGHGGYQTSQLLSRVLIKAVALELSSLVPNPLSSANRGILDRVKSYWPSSTSSTNNSQNPLDADPTHVSHAIQAAFTKLDKELINAPLRVLANNLDEASKKNKLIPDLSQHPLALTAMLPAISGSCALLAVFDTAHRNLYLACTGDSRAVAGIWEPSENGKGQWRVEVLTEDQTGRNPSELARMQSEHPKEESDDVIRNGRVLGGLEPTRAFGDARYKWPRVVQETLSQAFLVGNNQPLRSPPSLFKTPPYVTAMPVVTHRKLSFTPTSGPSSEKAIRFLVLATDGLWDQLSNDEVVSLVGGHLTGLKGNILKSDLPSVIPTSSGSLGVDGKNKNKKVKEGLWAFNDENVSTHLIRNAFGGGDVSHLRRLISIPAPYSRRYRDDVTVTVVWWEEGNEEGARITTEKIKSKL